MRHARQFIEMAAFAQVLAARRTQFGAVLPDISNIVSNLGAA